MTVLWLSRVAERLDAHLKGADVSFSALTTDSREPQDGALFVALTGERFDGHEFVEAAARQGAVAAVVARPLAIDLPQLVVQDTRLALGRVATSWREASMARVVALTGSNGKTTLKEMLAAILRQRGRVLATQGNLNNDIGVPLTLARLDDENFAVVELGANHAGEIDYLARLTRPHVAVLNNAGRAHLEGFGSLEGVARAKAEIINGLEPGGVFVCPGDSGWTPMWRELAKDHRVLTFGTQEGVDVFAPADGPGLEWTATGFVQAFPVHLPGGEFRVQLALAGLHNRRNALAAITAAQALGIDMEAMVAGLAEIQPVPGRLCPVAARNEVRLIDDSYNANPESVIAAMSVLSDAPGRRFLVLGDLAELGADGTGMTGELGVRAREFGLDGLYTLGGLSRHASAAFGDGGGHFDELPDLLAALTGLLRPGDTVLVKGSRSARMERVVAALAADEEKLAC
jgi:UDP-N-acetylmuramoyl-tripeptide--D-alanyl-D-alanine ligase